MRRQTNSFEIEPRGLSRVLAAFYVGVSPSLFDAMVEDERMPKPKQINSRVLWDRRELDEAFDALPNRDDRNPSAEEKDGRMPPPKCVDFRRIWDREKLDKSFDELPDREDHNPWDEEGAE